MERKRAQMKNYISPKSIVSEVKMSRTRKKDQTYLLVEGESDIGFYKNVVDKQSCKIKFCDGRENVEIAIDNCNKARLQGVIGIADRDFDLIRGIEIKSDNLFFTDTHDLETMSLKDGTFLRLNNEYGDDEKIEKFEEKYGLSIFQRVLQIGCLIGKARLVDVKNKFDIGFNEMELKEYVTDDLDFNFKQFIANAIRGSKQKNNRIVVEQKIDEEILKEYDTWHLCRGHDLTQIIAACYSNEKRGSVGNNSARFISASVIERELRMSYMLSSFYKTTLYTDLKDWQSNNVDTKIINM